MIYVLLHCCIVQPTITITTYKKWQLHNDSLLFSHVCYWMAFTPVKAPSTPLSWNLQFPCLKQMHFTWKERNIQCLKKKQQQPKKRRSASTFWVRYFLKWYIPLAKHSLGGIKEFPTLKGLFLGCIWARTIDHRCAPTLMSNWSRKRATFKAFLTVGVGVVKASHWNSAASRITTTVYCKSFLANPDFRDKLLFEGFYFVCVCLCLSVSVCLSVCQAQTRRKDRLRPSQ